MSLVAMFAVRAFTQLCTFYTVTLKTLLPFLAWKSFSGSSASTRERECKGCRVFCNPGLQLSSGKSPAEAEGSFACPADKLPAGCTGGQLLSRVVLPCSQISQRKPLWSTRRGFTPQHLKNILDDIWANLGCLAGLSALPSHLLGKILTMLNVSWSRSSSSSSPMGIGSLPAVMWTGPCDLFPLLPDLASPPLGFTRTNYTHHTVSQNGGSQVTQLTTSTLLLLAVGKPGHSSYSFPPKISNCWAAMALFNFTSSLREQGKIRANSLDTNMIFTLIGRNQCWRLGREVKIKKVSLSCKE